MQAALPVPVPVYRGTVLLNQCRPASQNIRRAQHTSTICHRKYVFAASKLAGRVVGAPCLYVGCGSSSNLLPPLDVPCDKPCHMYSDTSRQTSIAICCGGPGLLLQNHPHNVKEHTLSLQGATVAHTQALLTLSGVIPL